LPAGILERLGLGAFYYVDKPLDLAFLSRLVAKALQRKPNLNQ